MSLFSLFKTHELTERERKLSLWGVSWMSFFLSLGTMMVYSIFPIIVREVMGASYTQAGLIEGAAILVAFFCKGIFGVLSDVFRHRKPLIGLGILSSVLIKLIFATAHSIGVLSLARFMDRAVKGMRSSPTDALIADLSKANVDRGISYGLYKTLSMLGVVAGSALAGVMMYMTNRDHHLVFYISMIPGIIALLLLFLLVKQPPIHDEIKKSHSGWRIDDIKYLPKEFWVLLLIAFILMLARFSESNIIYRARTVGWPIEYTPAINVGMELMSAALVYPIGRLADKSNRMVLLLRGMFILFLANMIFMSTESMVGVAVGTLFAGASLGMTQGLLSTLIADSTPAELRGTAFAIYYWTVGISLSVGNYVAGSLNDAIGTVGCFCGGLAFTSLAMLALWNVMSRTARQERLLEAG